MNFDSLCKDPNILDVHLPRTNYFSLAIVSTQSTFRNSTKLHKNDQFSQNEKWPQSVFILHIQEFTQDFQQNALLYQIESKQLQNNKSLLLDLIKKIYTEFMT